MILIRISHFAPFTMFCGWTPIFGEIHSYYSDGSFSFTRSVQNEGWVNIHVIDDVTIEVFFWYLDVPVYPPEQSVLIRRIPGNDTLLVAQSLTGLFPLSHLCGQSILILPCMHLTQCYQQCCRHLYPRFIRFCHLSHSYSFDLLKSERVSSP